MPSSINCPKCKVTLLLPDGAPPRLLCPRCLCAIIRARLAQSEIPRSAIPIDIEIERDIDYVNFTLLFLAVGLVAGGLIGGWKSPSPLTGLLIIGGVAVGIGTFIIHSKSHRSWQIDQVPSPTLPPRDGPVLEYQGRVSRSENSDLSSGAQATLGFFTWIGGIIIAYFVIAGMSRNLSDAGAATAAVIFLVGLSSVATAVRMTLKWKGFIPGVLLGLGVTCLLPIGIIFVICGH